jgi:predicted RNase H-like HicB family nuclease
MKYPIAIEPGSDKKAWGVIVPDLAGCFSAADSGIDEAIENTKEAIELWIEMALDANRTSPSLVQLPTYKRKRNSRDISGRLPRLIRPYSRMRLRE